MSPRKIFRVEQILSKRKYGGRQQYQVKWEKGSVDEPDEITWVYAEDILDKKLIDNFEFELSPPFANKLLLSSLIYQFQRIRARRG